MTDRVPVPTVRRFSQAQIEHALSTLGPMKPEWEPKEGTAYDCRTGRRLQHGVLDHAPHSAAWKEHLTEQKQSAPTSGVLPLTKKKIG